jgi:DOPA 4,5-dioxygenase
MTDVTIIQGFHAHVYFDAGTRPTAERLREALGEKFDVKLGTVHAQPVGPHPKGMFQVAFAPDQFAAVVPWLMVNRAGLSIFVHPTTDDPVADHDTNPLWMGDPLPIHIEFVRRLVQRRVDQYSTQPSKHDEGERR